MSKRILALCLAAFLSMNAFAGWFSKKPDPNSCEYWLVLFSEISELEEMLAETYDPSHRFIIRMEIRARMIEGADGKGRP